MKFINELTEKQRKELIKDVKLNVFVGIKGLFAAAEQYDINKEELFDLWCSYEQKCFNQMQAKNIKGLTFDEGMKILKAILHSGKGDK